MPPTENREALVKLDSRAPIQHITRPPGETMEVVLTADNNHTLLGTLVLENFHLEETKPSSTVPPRDYDDQGATMYALAVLFVYSFSIVLLIASHTYMKRKSPKREGEDQSTVNHYLQQVPHLQELSRRDSFRRLKMSIIPLVSIAMGRGISEAQTQGSISDPHPCDSDSASEDPEVRTTAVRSSETLGESTGKPSAGIAITPCPRIISEGGVNPARGGDVGGGGGLLVHNATRDSSRGEPTASVKKGKEPQGRSYTDMTQVSTFQNVQLLPPSDEIPTISPYTDIPTSSANTLSPSSTRGSSCGTEGGTSEASPTCHKPRFDRDLHEVVGAPIPSHEPFPPLPQRYNSPMTAPPGVYLPNLLVRVPRRETARPGAVTVAPASGWRFDDPGAQREVMEISVQGPHGESEDPFAPIQITTV